MPLTNRLRKESHKRVAYCQDIIMQELCTVFDDAVLHGGTALWRCYRGSRFSEDIDVYLRRDVRRIDRLFDGLVRRGMVLLKKKVGERSIYAELRLERTSVRFEAVFRTVTGVLAEYEMADGTLLTVYTLTPEQLLCEKVDAYGTRRKVRDLYDIFFLLRHVTTDVKQPLRRLLQGYAPPDDEADLKALIYEGVCPPVAKMLDYIRERA